LAGQHEQYLKEALQEYKEGERANPIMAGMVANLSEQDMADLAAYFASQTEKVGEADPSLLEKGQLLYRAGDQERGIPACIGCHGPAGQGNGPANFPKLGGQNPDYVIAALKAYQTGQRTEGPMQDIAFKMNDTDMQAVASYIYGLYPAGTKLPEETKTSGTAAPATK
jgi:cytochrome c553